MCGSGTRPRIRNINYSIDGHAGGNTYCCEYKRKKEKSVHVILLHYSLCSFVSQQPQRIRHYHQRTALMENDGNADAH